MQIYTQTSIAHLSVFISPVQQQVGQDSLYVTVQPAAVKKSEKYIFSCLIREEKISQLVRTFECTGLE